MLLSEQLKSMLKRQGCDIGLMPSKILQSNIDCLDEEEKQFLLLSYAYVASNWSECERKHVGCVIMPFGWDRGWYELCYGWNKPPFGHSGCPGQDHCRLEKPTGWSGCLRTVHAEPNALADAAERLLSTNGLTCYCTTKPCLECAKILVQFGIYKCIFVDVNEGIPEQFNYLVKSLIMEQASPRVIKGLRQEGYIK